MALTNANLGFHASVDVTRPSNTTAYTASDVIGAADSATPANAGSAIIELPNMGVAGETIALRVLRLQFAVTTLPSGMTTFRIHLFNAPPTAILDNAAFSAQPADRSKYLGEFTTSAAAVVGGAGWVEAFLSDINRDLRMVTTSLFAVIETIGGFTPASGTALTLKAHALKV